MTKVSWSKLPASLLCLILSFSTFAGSNPDSVTEKHGHLDGYDLDELSESSDYLLLADILLECQNDVVVTIQNHFNCDTTVYFAPPVATGGCPITGSVVQTSGPTPDSAPGAGDGTPLVPGIYTAEYEYSDADGVVRTCAIEIDVRSGYAGVMSCQDLNVSVNQDCEILITPFMILTGESTTFGCASNFQLEITDEYGNVMGVPHPDGVILTANALQKELTASVDVVGGGNSCWADLLLEDKFPPQITCPTEPIITTCNGLDFIELPVSGDNCANEAELIIVEETSEPYDCDPEFLTRVTRTYVAVDGNGIESIPCVVEIFVRRIDFDDIDFPSDLSPFTGSGLACDDVYAVDDYGNPHPCPTTGSGTGVPTIYGNPLKPGAVSPFCNIYVDYEDQVLNHGCTTKVMRSWTVREWHCSGEYVSTGLQFIEITDDEGPVVEPMLAISGSTSYGCEGSIVLPPIQAYDVCGEVSHVDVSYPGGVLQESNGGLVTLPVGPNTVTYTVYDGCYNSTSVDVDVWITDSTQPVTVCEINTVVSLPHDGNTEVWAETFDDGSHDECGLKEILVRRMDPDCTTEDILFDDSVFFCCEDVGKEVQVVLRAVDWSGNYNECMVNVHVQDKIAPVIACPADMTLYCTDPYDLTNPNVFFGEPTVTDNCSDPSNVQQKFTNEVDQCNTGVLYREIFVTDEGGEVISTCTQKITILPTEPFDASDIIWPLDFSLEGCNTANLEPERLDPIYAFPTVAEGQCDLVGYNWDDEVFSAVPGSDACFKIIRHWTLINWCEIVDEEYTTYEYDQVLIVSNTIDPEVTCQPVVFSSNDANCDEVPIDVTVMGMDDCTMDLQHSWRIDLGGDGTFEDYGAGYNIQGVYPVGDHLIEWTVQDLCGNETYCVQPLKIENNKPPQAVCVYGLSVDLNPMDLDGDGEIDNEMVVLWASDFNQESFQPCGNEIVASFSSDITDTNLELDCDDLGIYYVDLYITDLSTGLYAICQTFVDVQDNNNVDFCSGDGGMRADVSGNIRTEDDKMVEDVEVNLFGSLLQPDMTDEEGDYAFPNMPLGGQYEIDPVKNDDYLNGVSTIDILIIQRHILDMTELDSPYKRIAADVNMSETISGLDLIQIRKLILGIYNEFPSVDSWRFIDAEHQFADESNPWASPFDEDYTIASLDDDMLIDFVGVKMGDVNGTVETNFTNNPEVEERAGNVQLDYEIVNDIFTSSVNIYGSEKYNVSGAQMVIELNDDFVITELVPLAWSIKESHYRISDNKVIISYDAPYGIESDVDEALFTIVGEGQAASIKIDEARLNAEVYAQDLSTQNLQLSAKEDIEFAVSNANPNPWTNETNIDVTVNAAQGAEMEIYNTTGQLLTKKDISLKAGVNTITLTHSDFNEYGTMMIRIKTKSFDHNLRVVHIK